MHRKDEKPLPRATLIQRNDTRTLNQLYAHYKINPDEVGICINLESGRIKDAIIGIPREYNNQRYCDVVDELQNKLRNTKDANGQPLLGNNELLDINHHSFLRRETADKFFNKLNLNTNTVLSSPATAKVQQDVDTTTKEPTAITRLPYECNWDEIQDNNFKNYLYAEQNFDKPIFRSIRFINSDETRTLIQLYNDLKINPDVASFGINLGSGHFRENIIGIPREYDNRRFCDVINEIQNKLRNTNDKNGNPLLRENETILHHTSTVSREVGDRFFKNLLLENNSDLSTKHQSIIADKWNSRSEEEKMASWNSFNIKTFKEKLKAISSLTIDAIKTNDPMKLAVHKKEQVLEFLKENKNNLTSTAAAELKTYIDKNSEKGQNLSFIRRETGGHALFGFFGEQYGKTNTLKEINETLDNIIDLGSHSNKITPGD